MAETSGQVHGVGVCLALIFQLALQQHGALRGFFVEVVKFLRDGAASISQLCSRAAHLLRVSSTSQGEGEWLGGRVA